MKFGLPDSTIESVQKVFETNSKIDEVIVFGSRAKGNYKEGSDIDLATKGKNINLNDILSLSRELDELNLPYTIDLINYATINDKNVVEHIDRIGIVFYERWKKYKLGELCTNIDYGYTASANHNPVGPKFLRITDIVPQLVNWETVPYCEIDKKNHAKYKLEKGDIVIARTGATTGYNYTFKNDVDAVFASYLIRYKIDKAKANPFFIDYSLKSNNWVGFVEGIIGGSAQPGANAKMFAAYELLLPPLKEQSAIASILSSLDNKIDLLHRQNKTLEQLAETLFRQWFVGETDDSWKILNLYNAIDLVGGGTPRTEVPEFWNGNIDWLSGGDIASNHKGFVMSSEKKISENGLNSSPANLLPKFSTVISARGTVGKYCILSKPMAFSQSNYGIKPKYKGCFFFTYLLIAYCVDELIASAYGSVFDTITTETFKGAELILPSEEMISEFEIKIKPYFLKVFNNQMQIAKLTQLRETLLPKLISGEVRVEL